MQDRSISKVEEVFGNADIAGIILSYGKDYCNFRLTCKYTYLAVDRMSFGVTLKRANSFKPNQIVEFFYNHPVIFASTMTVCFGILGGSNMMLNSMKGALISSLSAGCAVSCMGMLEGLHVAFKQGETDISSIMSRMRKGVKASFITGQENGSFFSAACIGFVTSAGFSCVTGLGGVAGLVHDQCESTAEAGIVRLATGAAMVGFFAKRNTIKHNLESREKIREEIEKEFLPYKKHIIN